MVTGSFPENFDDNLRKKFNAFLILFGQMYPCKLCANHFMQLLKEHGLFEGTTKKDLMEYLCVIHNKVNDRLGHPVYDCSKAYTAWNTCGCGSETLWHFHFLNYSINQIYSSLSFDVFQCYPKLQFYRKRIFRFMTSNSLNSEKDIKLNNGERCRNIMQVQSFLFGELLLDTNCIFIIE